MRAATPLTDITEKEWQAQVVALTQTLGWRKIYHVYDSRRSHSGFPDLVLVRERIVYLELKREAGKLTEPQRSWVAALLDAGAEAYVARPSDLDALAKILACRGDPWLTDRGKVTDAACALRDKTRRETQ